MEGDGHRKGHSTVGTGDANATATANSAAKMSTESNNNAIPDGAGSGGGGSGSVESETTQNNTDIRTRDIVAWVVQVGHLLSQLLVELRDNGGLDGSGASVCHAVQCSACAFIFFFFCSLGALFFAFDFLDSCRTNSRVGCNVTVHAQPTKLITFLLLTFRILKQNLWWCRCGGRMHQCRHVMLPCAIHPTHTCCLAISTTTKKC